MTRTVPIDFTKDKPVFDFSGPAADFACTGQRAAILTATLEGSVGLFKEAGTLLPAMPGTVVFTTPEKFRRAVASAQKNVKKNLKENPTPYPYEHCAALVMTPTVDKVDQATVGMIVYSEEGVYYGTVQ